MVLVYNFSQEFKDRFFDVGIAEQHAVTFSAGLASMGLIPSLQYIHHFTVHMTSLFMMQQYAQYCNRNRQG